MKPTEVYIMYFSSGCFAYSLELSDTAMLPLTIQDPRLDWSCICSLMVKPMLCLFLIYLLKQRRGWEFVWWFPSCTSSWFCVGYSSILLLSIPSYSDAEKIPFLLLFIYHAPSCSIGRIYLIWCHNRIN